MEDALAMRNNKKYIDIVVPCYNEEECIPLFFNEVTKVMNTLEDNYNWSVLYVDDGSVDNSLREMRLLSEENPNKVKYISFSRNFGKEAANYAGLKKSNGDMVVLIDCDLQHPPSLIPEMLEAIRDGYDDVATYRINRKGEPPVRSWFAERFYALINSMSSVKMKPAACDYRMMTRKYVDALLQLSETERFSKGLFQWVGFDTKWIPFENTERVAGKTKWSFFKLFGYAVSGFVSFSTVPLRIASIIGTFTVLIAIVFGLVTLINALCVGVLVGGFSVIATLILFFSGIIISLLGIIGEYMACMCSEVKRRPIFISKEEKL